jgi:serine/threonine protein kinase
MSKVYSAEDSKLGLQVALKILTRDLTKNREHLPRLKREARSHKRDFDISASNSLCTSQTIADNIGDRF